MSDEDTDRIRSEFDDVPNTGTKELKDGLATEESQSVGNAAGDEESTGHFMGRRIVEIQQKRVGDLDDDVAAMKTVHGYVARHRKQKPSQEDVETSKWRYSLMNRGHDPLK